jgi:hypothetical protein
MANTVLELLLTSGCCMSQNIGETLGKLAGEAICKAGSCKPIPVQGKITMYSKPGKKPMPQPKYVKQANPFLSLMAAGAFETMPRDEEPKPAPRRRAPVAKKMPARGPIRGTMAMRRKPRQRPTGNSNGER